MGAFDDQIRRSDRAFELLKIGLFHFLPHRIKEQHVQMPGELLKEGRGILKF